MHHNEETFAYLFLLWYDTFVDLLPILTNILKSDIDTAEILTWERKVQKCICV